MSTTWTALFTVAGAPTGWSEDEMILATPECRAMLERLADDLRASGRPFGEAFDEGHGWDAVEQLHDETKTLEARLVVAPGEDPDQPCLWRVVVGLDLGFWGATRQRRRAMLIKLAKDVDAACRRIGGSDIVWENGDLAPPH